jgi:hypothetical protein
VGAKAASPQLVVELQCSAILYAAACQMISLTRHNRNYTLQCHRRMGCWALLAMLRVFNSAREHRIKPKIHMKFFDITLIQRTCGDFAISATVETNETRSF